ncbi:MAG: hypothetical protein ACP5RD_08945, partial [bacterium]
METKSVNLDNITIYGTDEQINEAKNILEKVKFSKNESADRLILQQLIDQNNITATIFYNNSRIWSKNDIIHEFKRMLKFNNTSKGITKQLYEFFYSECGTGTHMDMLGWAAQYPDNNA